ncbi:uncharacterized protein DSM5745_02929 [Aspergillus mulundensis]|uniref:Uncharacterized protein n=1 Tax=Aspergillus mulundensis TaxID=1810919 RepID=A0A3D8SIZ1_9EURO|nr:Uncharacterized protein DSM5745_02929 [Aspergillus mulundensis]RDW86287.1 Uncharacterized protein DSM5745_02929 [Aspergillus mulundensis]
MSGPFQRPPLNTSHSTPIYPGGETPVSFKPNVNRAKTKRWVEAKKYSYDGDDWGEDEYGEYEYDDQPPEPQTQLTAANRSTPHISSTLSKGASHPPLPSTDRSRSMERAQTMPTESPAASGSPTTPIIRPADIYKRMRGEQQARQPSPAATSSDERTPVASPPVIATSESSENTVPLPGQASVPTHNPDAVNAEQPNTPPVGTNEPPTIALPEVKRLSAFDSSFFGESGPAPQSNQEPAGQPHQLQHNPSLGFRSAVNQAFDVPETPSTITDSVARSNSDSTTGISPIIPRRGTTDDKTPTIHEEPNENTDTPTDGDIVFKPGHRRDLSIPSPGNSPSRRPVIAGPDANASSELAQISSETPASPLVAQPQPHVFNPDIPQPSRETTRDDLPAPLNVQTNMASGSVVSTENIPVIIPAMSAENSPEDTENDRLRKEIIRSLSRENSPSDHQDNDTPPHTSRQDSLFPREYETYRPAAQTAAPQEPHQSGPTFDTILQTPSTAQPSSTTPQPKLKKRFSWEESSDDEDATAVTQAQPARPPPMPGQFPLSQDSVLPESFRTPTDQRSETAELLEEKQEPPTPERPKLTVVPPVAMDSMSIQSSGHGHESSLSQTTEALARAEEGESFSPVRQSFEPPAQLPPVHVETGLLGFKDILNMQSPYERIQSFDRTRDQFAAVDTGLGNWLQVTFHAHPEHNDVVNRNNKPLSEEFKNSVPRTKFPKLASLGNLASSLQDGSHSASGHIRRPSAPLGSMRQPSGKDFLHTAGVLGGQAGKAAKGLFSKGRSKLKGSGGSEKVEP